MVQHIIKKKIKTINKKNVSNKFQRGGVVSRISDLNTGDLFYFRFYEYALDGAYGEYKVIGNFIRMDGKSIVISIPTTKTMRAEIFPIVINNIINIQELKDSNNYYANFFNTDSGNNEQSVIKNEQIMEYYNEGYIFNNLEELVTDNYYYVYYKKNDGHESKIIEKFVNHTKNGTDKINLTFNKSGGIPIDDIHYIINLKNNMNYLYQSTSNKNNVLIHFEIKNDNIIFKQAKKTLDIEVENISWINYFYGDASIKTPSSTSGTEEEEEEEEEEVEVVKEVEEKKSFTYYFDHYKNNIKELLSEEDFKKNIKEKSHIIEEYFSSLNDEKKKIFLLILYIKNTKIISGLFDRLFLLKTIDVTKPTKPHLELLLYHSFTNKVKKNNKADFFIKIWPSVKGRKINLIEAAKSIIQIYDNNIQNNMIQNFNNIENKKSLNNKIKELKNKSVVKNNDNKSITTTSEFGNNEQVSEEPEQVPNPQNNNDNNDNNDNELTGLVKNSKRMSFSEYKATYQEYSFIKNNLFTFNNKNKKDKIKEYFNNNLNFITRDYFLLILYIHDEDIIDDLFNKIVKNNKSINLEELLVNSFIKKTERNEEYFSKIWPLKKSDENNMSGGNPTLYNSININKAVRYIFGIYNDDIQGKMIEYIKENESMTEDSFQKKIDELKGQGQGSVTTRQISPVTQVTQVPGTGTGTGTTVPRQGPGTAGNTQTNIPENLKDVLKELQDLITKINKVEYPNINKPINNDIANNIIEKINKMELLKTFNNNLINFLNNFKNSTITIGGEEINLFNDEGILNELEYSRLINGQLGKSNWPSEKQINAMMRYLKPISSKMGGKKNNKKVMKRKPKKTIPKKKIPKKKLIKKKPIKKKIPKKK